MNRQRKHAGGGRNRLRIIAGHWRGRKLDFPTVEGLRPTPDRVRETLFNWLQADIVDARCLDLFTGSGALGLEALSRGADYVLMVDNHPEVIQQLRQHLETLQASSAEVRQGDGLQILTTGPGELRFDIVFLDPPFGKGLIPPCIEALVANGWLAEHARVYIETESGQEELKLPDQWEITRQQKAGHVTSYLIST